MSIASALPTARVSRCVPPAPGMTPSWISGWPKRARLRGDDQVARASRARSRRRGSSRRPPRRAACGCRGSRPSDRRGGVWYSAIGDPRASSVMSAPAANARCDPPSTMQRTASSRSSSCSASTSSSMSASGQRVQLLRPVEQHDRDRVVALDRTSSQSRSQEGAAPPPALRRRASTSRASRARGSPSRATRGRARSSAAASRSASSAGASSRASRPPRRPSRRAPPPARPS